jgi:transposase-like protein
MRKKYSLEEKINILQEADTNGIAQTCRKFNIAPSLFYKWKDQYLNGGSEALKPKHHHKTVIDPELIKLRDENERLKKMVAEKELIIQIKDELVKKTLQREMRK